MRAISFEPDHSPLLAALVRHRAMIIARLADVDSWDGWSVIDAGAASERLICRDRLRPPDGSREYIVSAHAFAGTGAGELHDHRWPLAVYPAGEGARSGEPLYDMAWEHAGESGTIVVRAHAPYAIDDCTVRHAVASRRSHVSVVLVDVTQPPTRENRLTTSPMAPAAVASTLGRVRRAFDP